MKEGDVLLARLPQSNGQVKIRPVVALRRMPGFGDLLVCGISTQLHQEIAGFDEIFRSSDDDFKSSGLKAASLTRLAFLATLPVSAFLGVIGTISKERRERLLSRLAAQLKSGH